MTDKRRIGDTGEDIACKYLKKHKFKIIERNFSYIHKEIDIIATNKKYILFVEVKTRKDKEFSTAAQAVTYKKQQNLIVAAHMYIKTHNVYLQPRFDVIEVYYNADNPKEVEVNHIENAFEQRGEYGTF